MTLTDDEHAAMIAILRRRFGPLIRKASLVKHEVAIAEYFLAAGMERAAVVCDKRRLYETAEIIRAAAKAGE